MRHLLILLMSCATGMPTTSPKMTAEAATKDLASPSQATRDAAAEALRASFSPPPRSRWDALVFQEGDDKAKVLAALPKDATPGPGAAGGGSYSESYRLDGLWAITCWFVNDTDKVITCQLGESMQYVWVEPPEGFTGVWTTYHVNGQPSHEIHYRGGEYMGTFTSFYPSGDKAVVQTYGPKGIEGKEVGYFPSGKVNYRGQHKHGEQVGTWTWYDEAGNEVSREEH